MSRALSPWLLAALAVGTMVIGCGGGGDPDRTGGATPDPSPTERARSGPPPEGCTEAQEQILAFIGAHPAGAEALELTERDELAVLVDAVAAHCGIDGAIEFFDRSLHPWSGPPGSGSTDIPTDRTPYDTLDTLP